MRRASEPAPQQQRRPGLGPSVGRGSTGFRRGAMAASQAYNPLFRPLRRDERRSRPWLWVACCGPVNPSLAAVNEVWYYDLASPPALPGKATSLLGPLSGRLCKPGAEGGHGNSSVDNSPPPPANHQPPPTQAGVPGSVIACEAQPPPSPAPGHRGIRACFRPRAPS